MNTAKDTILVRAPNWIGDAVVATAVLKPLKSHRPESRILVVANHYVAPLFAHHPYLEGILTFNGFADGIRRISGDTGIILPNSFSSALLFFLSRVKRRIGYRNECRGFLLTDALAMVSLKEEHLVENYKRLACVYLGSSIDDPFIPELSLSAEERHMDPFGQLPIPAGRAPAIVDPGSAYGAAKVWQVDKYAAVVDYLAERKGLPVVLLGSNAGERIAHEIRAAAKHTPFDLTGKLTLRTAMVAISKSRIFISPDTGGMHIAAALSVPQVAIFGSSSPVWTRPLNEKSRVVYQDLECSPCFKRTCPLNTYACLTSITPEEVIGTIEEVL